MTFVHENYYAALEYSSDDESENPDPVGLPSAISSSSLSDADPSESFADLPELVDIKLPPDAKLKNQSNLISLCASSLVGTIQLSIEGPVAKFTLGFFRSTAPIVSTAGSFLDFAAVGAIGMPVFYLPYMYLNNLIEENPYFITHPNQQAIAKTSLELAFHIGIGAVGAALNGNPIGATILCVSFFPAMYALWDWTHRLTSGLQAQPSSAPAV